MARVLVPLAPGCEELEAVTVIDLLRRAGIEVVTAGLDDLPVRASRGTVLVPDVSLDEALRKKYDMIVLPGGLPGADHLNNDPRIHRVLKRMADGKGYIGAICAAPRVLATFTLFGNPAVLTEELLRVALFLAGFSGFYFTIYVVTDATFQGVEPNDPFTGQATITGANNSSVTLIAVDSVNVTLEVDADGDGIPEETIPTTWDAL